MKKTNFVRNVPNVHFTDRLQLRLGRLILHIEEPSGMWTSPVHSNGTEMDTDTP